MSNPVNNVPSTQLENEKSNDKYYLKYLKYKQKYQQAKELITQLSQQGGNIILNVYHQGGDLEQGKMAARSAGVVGVDSWFDQMRQWSEYHDSVSDAGERADAVREINKMLGEMNGLLNRANSAYRFKWDPTHWAKGSRKL